jgi:hypothetical protein
MSGEGRLLRSPSRNPLPTTMVDPAVAEFFPEPDVKDNHRSDMTEFFPESDTCDGGGSGMKEFFLESDACNDGGYGCEEVSPAFSIRVRVSAYCRFD